MGGLEGRMFAPLGLAYMTSLLASLEFMRNYEEGLSSVRYPRDNVSQRLAEQNCPAFELGKGRYLGGSGVPAPTASTLASFVPECDAAIVAFGTTAIDSLVAADQLAKEGYRVAVYDARFAKPIDRDMVRALLEAKLPVVTVEDHGIVGGFGACFLEAAADLRLDSSRITRLALPDSWIMQDSRAKQLAEAGLDAVGIARAVRLAVEANGATRGGASNGAPVRVKAPVAATII